MTNSELQQYFSDFCYVRDNIIRLGTAQLPKSDYAQIKKLLESMGGRWKGGKTSGFVFDTDAEAVYSSICSGDMENKKNIFQFFPTPDSISDRMAELLDISGDCPSVLEPSAGRGSLIKAVHRKHPDVIIDAYEVNPDCYYALETLDNVRLHKSDFLDAPEDDKYDYIIANPPFANNADIRHFRKMMSLLKDKGTLCCIISSHAMTVDTKETSEFREWLYSLYPEVEELPEGTFKEAGTNVRTFIVTVRK